MSAFLVDPAHVCLVVEYAIATDGGAFQSVQWLSDESDPASWRRLDRMAAASATSADGLTLADETVRVLLAANLDSVRYRYGDEEYPEGGADIEAQTRRYQSSGYVLSDAEAVRACDCLEYQSCEHDGWQESEACRILAAIREHACDRLARDALAREWGAVSPPWEWSGDVIEMARRRREGVRT